MQLEDLVQPPTSQQPLTITSLGHLKQNQPRSAMPDQHGQEEEDKTTELGVPWEVPSSMNTGSASVSQIYDSQKESDQVLQKGTEAIFKVSQSNNNEQLANFDTLHGKPDPLPSKPLPLDQNKSEGRQRKDARKITQDRSTNHQGQLTVVEHKTTPSQGSSNNQLSPANSTPFIDLRFIRQDCEETQITNDGCHPEGKVAEFPIKNCKDQEH